MIGDSWFTPETGAEYKAGYKGGVALGIILGLALMQVTHIMVHVAVYLSAPKPQWKVMPAADVIDTEQFIVPQGNPECYSASWCQLLRMGPQPDYTVTSSDCDSSNGVRSCTVLKPRKFDVLLGSPECYSSTSGRQAEVDGSICHITEWREEK